MSEEREFYSDSERGVKVQMIPIDQIDPNEWNPNVMNTFTMNQLADDMEEMGCLQPILVTRKDDGRYRIIDGEHRYDGAKLCDMTEIPGIVVEQGALAKSEDEQQFQTVRMNKLRGKLDKRKFRKMVEGLASRYPTDVLAEKLAFDDPSQLDDMIHQARQSLPNDELRREFDQARDEIQTIDDLSLLLNRLFTQYGSTLDYGYMVLDYGGKDHIWVRLKDKSDFNLARDVGKMAKDFGVTFPSVLVSALRLVDSDFIEERLDVLEEAKESNAT